MIVTLDPACTAPHGIDKYGRYSFSDTESVIIEPIIVIVIGHLSGIESTDSAAAVSYHSTRGL